MNLQYPFFANSTEFDSLSSDLKVVDWYLNLSERQREHDEMVQMKDHLLRKFNSQLTVHAVEIKKAIEEKIQQKEPVDIQSAVKAAVETYAATKNREQSVMLSLRRRDLIDQIIETLKVVTVERLNEAFAQFDVSESSVEKKTELELLQNKIKQNELTQASYHKEKKLKRLFNGGKLPTVFRDMKVPDCKPEAIASAMALGFIRSWRERQQMFTEPVSVYGHKISDMPTERYRVWKDAYYKLGFDKLKTSPVYQPLPSNEPRITVNAMEHQGIGVFGQVVSSNPSVTESVVE